MGLGFGVAFGAVEPLAAAGRADGDLGIEDVFAYRVLVGWRFGVGLDEGLHTTS